MPPSSPVPPHPSRLAHPPPTPPASSTLRLPLASILPRLSPPPPLRSLRDLVAGPQGFHAEVRQRPPRHHPRGPRRAVEGVRPGRVLQPLRGEEGVRRADRRGPRGTPRLRQGGPGGGRAPNVRIGPRGRRPGLLLLLHHHLRLRGEPRVRGGVAGPQGPHEGGRGRRPRRGPEAARRPVQGMRPGRVRALQRRAAGPQGARRHHPHGEGPVRPARREARRGRRRLRRGRRRGRRSPPTGRPAPHEQSPPVRGQPVVRDLLAGPQGLHAGGRHGGKGRHPAGSRRQIEGMRHRGVRASQGRGQGAAGTERGHPQRPDGVPAGG